MSSLAERLSRIHLRVDIPGSDIQAELRFPDRFTISFGESVYEFLNERGLERCLTHAGRLLYAAWIREYRAATSDSFIEIDTPEDQAGRDFRRARAELAATGVSSDGKVTISAVDLQNVRVRITDGTARALSEQQFAASAGEAFKALLDDHSAKVRELKAQFFQ